MTVSKRMLLVIPLILWVALSIVVYSGIFVKLFSKTMAFNADWKDRVSNDQT